VAGHQVRDGSDDFFPQVDAGCASSITVTGREKAIRYAMIHSGKAAEIRRLASYQRYIE
jgi:hypothetical protein